MSLNLINPLSATTTSASRVSRNLLLSKGQELSSGLKNKNNNITDHMIGDNLKNSSKFMSSVKSNSVNAINITKQAESSLKHIANTIKTIKELSVTASSSNDTSKVNYLNDRYKSEVSSLINYIDQAKFHDTNLFNGDLQDLKVRIGTESNHTIGASIPKLLVTYQELGIENENIEGYKKAKTDLVEIEGHIKNISQEITKLENKIGAQKKLEDQLGLFTQEKGKLKDKLLDESNKAESLRGELDKLKLEYDSKKNELNENIKKDALELEKLNQLKGEINNEINFKEDGLKLNLQKLEKEKQENLDHYLENDASLAKKIVEKKEESLKLEDALSNTTKKRDLTKDKLDAVSEEIKTLSEEAQNLQNKIGAIQEEKEQALLKHSALEDKAKNQASNLSQDTGSIKKEIAKAEKSISKSQQNIEKYKTELEQIPQQLENKQKSKVKTENEIERLNVVIKEKTEKANEIKKINEELNEEVSGKNVIELDIDKLSVSKDEHKNLLDKINASIAIFHKNSNAYNAQVQKEEDKITKSKEKIEDLTNKLNSQNEQINTNLELEKVSKELNGLNQKIEQLEQELTLNKNKEQNLQISQNEISELHNQNNNDISALNTKLTLIDKELKDLEKDKNSISDNNLQSQLEEKLKNMQEEFALEDKALLNKLNDIEKDIELVSINKLGMENQISELGKFYSNESNKLNLGINKQQEFYLGLKKKISDLIENIENIEGSESANLELLEANLLKLKNQKNDLIEDSKNKKSEIEDFTNHSNNILKDHGGLFIREELQNSSLVDVLNITKSEEMIDVGIARLSGISTNINQNRSFLSEASDKITNTINLLNEVSDDYLSTDYEEAAQKYKQASLSLHAQMSIRAQGEMIFGEILKRIENK